MGGKDHDTRAVPGFIKRRNRIDGQFSGRLIEMLESPAWRVLTLSARKVIDRIYDESGYRYFLYQHDPNPPLSGDDDAWAKSLLPRA